MKLLNALFCRSSLICVVNERTYRNATRKVKELIQDGDLTRANSGLHAMRAWVRYELHTGRKGKRIKMASRLEQIELMLTEVHTVMSYDQGRI